jgi:hypothetical protein
VRGQGPKQIEAGHCGVRQSPGKGEVILCCERAGSESCGRLDPQSDITDFPLSGELCPQKRTREQSGRSIWTEVASDATHQVDDEGDDENCAEYDADIHVGLQWFSNRLIGPCDRRPVCVLPYTDAVRRFGGALVWV